MAWRSSVLPWLGLAAAVSVMAMWRTASEPLPPERQNLYRSRADCERDYDPAQCRSSASGGSYYGPRYITNESRPGDPGAGRTAAYGRSQAASDVFEISRTGGSAEGRSAARGGFGGTGRGFGGHGG